MRRFSILNLMGLVFAVAVAFAALRSANQWWAGGVLFATLGLLGLSVLAAYFGEGRKRAAWLGLFVMAGGYFLAIRTLPEQEAALLPTVQLIQFVQDRAGGNLVFTGVLKPGGSPNIIGTGTATFDLIMAPNSTTSPIQSQVGNAQTPIAALWTTIVPGAANGAAFRSIGHNLFALLFGWLGSLISLKMWTSRERFENSSNNPMA